MDIVIVKEIKGKMVTYNIKKIEILYHKNSNQQPRVDEFCYKLKKQAVDFTKYL